MESGDCEHNFGCNCLNDIPCKQLYDCIMENQYEEILNKEEFDAQMREQKQKRQERVVLFACVGFAIFTCLAFAFLLISFLFLGVCRIFTAEFSLIGLIRWLEGLPYVWIDDAKRLKSQLIIGIICFVFYLLIVILLIVNTVNIVRNMIKLSDTSINELDPKQLTTSIYTACISCFTFVFSFIALTSPTTTAKLPDITICLFIVFGLLIITEIIVKNIYIFYNFKKGTFNKKNFSLSLTRSLLLLSFTALLFALTRGGYIQSFLRQVLIYQPPENFTLSFELSSLVLQALRYLLTFCCVRIVNNTVKNSGLNMFEKAYDFYGKISYAPISSFKSYRDKVRKQTNRLIFLSIVCCVVELLPYLLVDWKFIFPENGISLLIKIGGFYLFIILMAIAIKVACKIPVRYKHRLSTSN